jgi:hypothetical protein
MNQEQAKAWLPLIQAYAEGKTIQICMNLDWIDISDISGYFDCGSSGFRIKPEPKKEWVRVGLWTAEGVMPRCYANELIPETQFEGRKYFGGWITDRIEYELPEGDA